jgi:hypothetical protein
LFFKQHRSRYYELLNGVRLNGNWEAWIDFFLEGVESTATAAVSTAHRLLALFRSEESKLGGLGRSGPSVRQVFAALCRRPLNSLGQLSAACDMSFPTAAKALEALVKLGIAREITGRQRNRLFAYDAYLAILSEGAEPLRKKASGLTAAQPGSRVARSAGTRKISRLPSFPGISRPRPASFCRSLRAVWLLTP